jgi:hypothetical protein
MKRIEQYNGTLNVLGLDDELVILTDSYLYNEKKSIHRIPTELVKAY